MDFSRSIKLNGNDLSEDGIMMKMLVIKDWFFDMVPRLEIVLTDSNDVLFNTYPIQDDSIIELEMNKNVDPDKQEDPIIIKFNVLDWSSMPMITGQDSGHVHEITGYLNVSDLFHPIVTKSFKEKTSGGVLKEIAGSLGLDYVKTIDTEPSDTMTWLQIGQNNHDMIKYVNNRSFFSDDDTSLTYVNLKNELIFTTLKTECEKEVAFVGKMGQQQQDDVQNNFNDVNSTTGDKKDIPTFFYSFATNKTLASRNKMGGYGTKSTYYDGKDEQANFPGNGNGDKLLNNLSQKNKNNVGQEVKHYEFGILNGGDQFSEGIHKEFFDSQVRHEYTISNFFKTSVIVKIKGNSLIKKYDIVDLVTHSSVDQEMNEPHSGKYIVGGIIHTLGDETEYSVQLVLYRSGINKPSKKDLMDLISDDESGDGKGTGFIDRLL